MFMLYMQPICMTVRWCADPSGSVHQLFVPLLFSLFFAISLAAFFLYCSVSITFSRLSAPLIPRLSCGSKFAATGRYSFPVKQRDSCLRHWPWENRFFAHLADLDTACRICNIRNEESADPKQEAGHQQPLFLNVRQLLLNAAG